MLKDPRWLVRPNSVKMHLPVTHWLLCTYAQSVLHQDTYARKFKIFSLPSSRGAQLTHRGGNNGRQTHLYTEKIGKELKAK